MQLVPQISQDLYDALGLQAQRPNVLVEFYAPDALPGADGFDPADAVQRIANSTVSFLGRSYPRYIKSVGVVQRTITEKFNSVSIDVDNADLTMAAFCIGQPIEGMLLVIRIVSREFVATTLSDSFVVFTGKCEKPFDANRETISLSAKQYIGSTEEEIPWRQFDPEDEEGRATNDPLFEGFLFSAKTGTVTYRERVYRGGFLGLLGFKKTVTRTLSFSSQQGVEIEKYVPLILGRVQAKFLPVGFIDAGGQINVVYAVSEGPIKQFWDLRVITSGFQFASIADNNPEVDQFRFGYPGGTNGQEPFLDNLAGGIPANGYYSNTAMMSTAIYGTDVAIDDPAPDVVGVMLGRLIPLPDEAGDFSLEDWSDNPAFQTRFVLTNPRIFNLDPAFINDTQCIKTACYCDAPVLDQTNGEVIMLQNSEISRYGVDYRRYHSTGLFTPQWFKHYYLGVGQDPPPELILPTTENGIVRFYDPAAGVPSIPILNLVRRRYTSNIYLTDKMKSVDFLFKVLLQTYNGFISQNARGKIDIKCKRPGDNTVIRAAAVATDTEVAVNSVLPWVDNLHGEVIVGNDLLTSEVRRVIATRYTAIANLISLSVSAGLSASGATLTGGDDDNPATGSVTVTGLGALTITIDGHPVSYTTISADTTGTAAAMLTQFLKADPTLKSYLKFTWDKDNPTQILIQSKLGFLELESELEEDHDPGEEVLRIQMSFADGFYTAADLAKSNILRGSVSWPIGGRQSSVNRVDGTFIDSPQGFGAQPLRVRDPDHIARVKRVLPHEITLTGVDGFSQAKRLENQTLAELRDLDFFMQHTSDRRALLLEEGDLICNTHASGGFRNVALRVEEVAIDLNAMTVNIVARRYSTSAYSDEAAARNVPLPTNLGGDSTPPDIAFNEADYPTNGLMQTTASDGITSVRGGAIFGASVYSQKGKVFLKRPGETSFTQIAVIEPDSNREAIFEFIASEEGPYVVQLETCFVGGSCSPNKPEATITIAFGVLGAILMEGGGVILTEGAGHAVSREGA